MPHTFEPKMELSPWQQPTKHTPGSLEAPEYQIRPVGHTPFSKDDRIVDISGDDLPSLERDPVTSVIGPSNIPNIPVRDHLPTPF